MDIVDWFFLSAILFVLFFGLGIAFRAAPKSESRENWKDSTEEV